MTDRSLSPQTPAPLSETPAPLSQTPAAPLPQTPPPRLRPSEARTYTFGPSALITPANGITVLRLLATPLLVALIMLWGASWVTVVIWGVLSVTDGIDGWVARRQGATRSGAFLDPLADKVVVLGALIALAANGTIPWLPVGIIAVREVGMSVYRSVVGRRGVSIPARQSAKIKTLVQDVAIGLCLIPWLSPHPTFLGAVVWVAAALTVFTGGQYYLDGRHMDPASGAPGS
jgi:CDP-diacylglycerol--glycerol-3-phosphate 3-phosphatidyltransferase